MTTLSKRKNGNGGLFPSLRDEFFNGNFFMPRVFDFDKDLFSGRLGGPPVNIRETEKEFHLDLSAPGLKREDFNVDVDNGMLTISSENQEEKNSDEKNYHRQEFTYSSFSRSFTLPENADENGINAKYENGVLCVKIPKKEVTTSKPKKQINVG